MIRRDNAVILNEDGEQIKKVQLKKKTESFDYDDKTYILNRKKHKYIKVAGLVRTYRYYIYNINNPEPLGLTIDKPKFTASQFNIMMKTKVLKDLNTVKSKFNFDWKVLLAIGIGVIILIYLLRGGSLA